MNILMAAGEMAPLVQGGGLADAVAELAGGLKVEGHEVGVVLPFYRAIRENKTLKIRKSGVRFQVQVGSSSLPCEISETKTAEGVRVFLVGRDEYFDRTGLYGAEGRDYQDNAARFVFFSKCVLELVRRMEPAPELLHLHGWETALVPVFARDQRLAVPTVLTPHGLAYQGNFWSYDFALTNLPGEYFSARGVEYYGSMNCLKGGLLFADAVVLPGERMVSEAQTSAQGCGLENVLRENAHKLYGILPALPDSPPKKGATPVFAGRDAQRRALAAEAGWTAEDGGPFFFVHTPASAGPGVEVVLETLDRLLTEGVKLILTGELGPELIRPMEVARRKHAGSFFYQEHPSETFLAQALAGADFFLVPGAVEPSAVLLRRALRAGCVPVVRQCGGLAQLVRDWEEAGQTGNGVVFWNAAADGLVDAGRRALKLWSDPERRDALRQNGRNSDGSVRAAARDHAALYQRLTAARPAAAA